MLGRPSLTWQGSEIDISALKPLALVYALAIHGDAVPKELLAELLWGRGKRNNVRTALYDLRREAHADAWLESEGDRVRLLGTSDLATFEDRVSRGDLAGALEIWRNAGISGRARTGLLEGFDLSSAPTFQDWLEIERTRVATLYLDCLSLRSAELQSEGRLDEALALARELIEEDPLNEDAHRRIMELAWRQGRTDVALDQFYACRRTLAEELGLEPVVATVQLFERIRAQSPSPPATELGGAPEASGAAFVGRSRELGEAEALLSRHRLLTVLGTGGIGKTRLALEMVARANATGPRKAVFVPLASLRHARFIISAIANAMHLTSTGSESALEQLASGLRASVGLLVLDNVEQLAGAADVVDALLGAVPDLDVVITSRTPLGLPMEAILRLRGLPYPELDAVDDGASYDAVRLFVTAARSLDPTFRLTDRNAPAVFRICRLLEGHPLGLELAAGWLRVHEPDALAAVLSRRLLELENPGLPLSERHSSLLVVMERSWSALEAEHRSVLAATSIFHGPFDLLAANAVAGANVATLTELVNRSLLRPTPNGRYDLHPLVREFAHEKLLASPDRSAVEARHARHFLQRLASRTSSILGRKPGPVLTAIDRDFHDIREAWLRAARSAWEDELLAAAGALGLFADMRVRFHEAVQLFGDAMELLTGSERATGTTIATLLAEQGTHLYRLGRYSEASAVAQRAREHLSGTEGEALHKVLRLKAMALARTGERTEALELLETVIGLSRDAAPEYASRDLRALANVEMSLGQYPGAEEHYRAAIDLDSRNGYLIGLAINSNNLSELLITTGRLDEAEQMIRVGLRHAEGVDVHLVPYLRLNAAELAFRRGDAATAVEQALATRELADTYGQANLLSRAAALMAQVALARSDVSEAHRHMAIAVATAHDARDMESLMHAFVGAGQIARADGDDRLAWSFLSCALKHPASEFSVRAEAERLLNGRLDRPRDDAPGEAAHSMSLETLVAAALR